MEDTSMRPRPATISCAVLVLALVLSGCGGTSSGQSATFVEFKSAAISSGRIPALYTCDGKDIHPAFEWGEVPANTGELVLMVVGLTPKAADQYSVSVEWAVSGINPRLHRIRAGRLPAAAHVGLGSDGARGYSICPKPGVTETYQFTLYAVRSSLEISPSFSGISVLSALSAPHTQNSAIGQGAFVALYKRA
jgi:phosphatidylethanolamine-binding protein (PEBP) family uncharacterized protein